jgi:type IV fimbrial biogenesis protein FimT
LWELLCAVVIAGITLGFGVPAFETVLLDARQTADVNAFVLAVQAARSEAAKRGHSVILCKTADLNRCGGNELRFDAGWMVFVDLDDTEPPQRSTGEPLIFAHEPELEGTITANRTYFEFRPRRRRSTNGTVVLCDRRGSTAARAVVVSYTARPRVSRVRPDGRPLQCAELS